jgi:hypothetical protein
VTAFSKVAGLQKTQNSSAGIEKISEVIRDSTDFDG